MLVAGCSGGGHGGGSMLPGTPLATSTAIAMANAARVTLSINIPPRQTQSFRRGQKFVPAGTTRKPSYVSPSTYYVSLNAVSGGTSIYSTYFTVAQCAPYGSVYECTTNLPYGTFTLYTNLYDQSGYLLSTNLYSNPAPVTVYPNGSPYDNYLYVQTAGVIRNLQTGSPSDCFAAGHTQAIPLYVLDADGNTIVGPVANPITPTFTAVNGAGLGAINIYAIYNASPVSINNVTITDTSLYASPYIFVSGSEGAINVAATFQNIPVYTNGTEGPSTYTPSAGYAAVGTYVAWGIQNGPLYGIYTIAIEQTLNQAVTCTGGVNGTFNTLTYIGTIKDPTSGNPYLVVSDNNNNVDVFDAYVTADYTRAYDYFASGFGSYGNPGPHSDLYQTFTFTTSLPLTNFFTSANTTGKINVLSSNGITSAVDYVLTSSGIGTSDSRYALQIPVTSSTRLAGTSTSLYYNDVGTPYIYAYDTSTLAYFPVIDMSAYAITGQVYSIAPTGSGSNTVMVRGASSGGNFFVCAFSAAGFSGSVYCGSSVTSTDTSPVSMQYDPGTGDLIFATGGTTVFGPYVHGVAPSLFTGTFLGSAIYAALSHSANRVLPGLEGVPGVAGLYGGPQASGPCAGGGEITWLRWNGSSWVYLAELCWPNHYITLTYQ
jgi:hypothetical protein